MSNVEKYKCLCTKQIINLSTPCHVFLSVRTISSSVFFFYALLFFLFFIFSRTRTEKRSIRQELYYANRRNWNGAIDVFVRNKDLLGLVIEAPSDEESRRERS